MKNKFLFGLLALVLCVLSLAFCYIPGSFRVYEKTTEDLLDTVQIHRDPGESVSLDLTAYPEAGYLVWLSLDTKERGYELTFRILHEGMDENLSEVVPAGMDFAVTYLPKRAERLTLTDTVHTVTAVEIHSGAPLFTERKIPLNLPGLLIMLGLSAVVLFLYYRYMVSHRSLQAGHGLWDRIRENRKILTGVGMAALAAGLLTGLILYVLRDEYGFNRQLFGYIFGALLALCFLIFWGVRLHEKIGVEGLFLGLYLIESLMLVSATPLGHSGYDVDTHYRFALADSYLGEVYATHSDELILNADEVTLMKDSRITNLLSAYQLGLRDEVYVDHFHIGISPAHFPAAAGLALGRLFGFDVKLRFLLGELFTLLLYGILTYIALRKLKSGKLVLMLIALFPANVFLSANLNYDSWVWGFSFVGIAWLIGERQQADRPVSAKDTLIMSGALAIACIPKQIYFPITLFPFFMPREKVKDRKKYVLYCLLPMALLLLSLLIRGTAAVGGTGDSRTGDLVNPGLQLQFVLSHMGTYLGTLFTFLGSFLSFDFFKQAVMYFGHLGYADLGFLNSLVMLLPLIAMVFDRGKEYAFVSGWKLRVYTLLCYVGCAMLVATSFYLIFTPVGLDGIMGVQARYLMPLVWPLLGLVYTYPCRFSFIQKGEKRWMLPFAAVETFVFFLALSRVLVGRIL